MRNWIATLICLEKTSEKEETGKRRIKRKFGIAGKKESSSKSLWPIVNHAESGVFIPPPQGSRSLYKGCLQCVHLFICIIHTTTFVFFCVPLKFAIKLGVHRDLDVTFLKYMVIEWNLMKKKSTLLQITYSLTIHSLIYMYLELVVRWKNFPNFQEASKKKLINLLICQVCS